MLSTAIQNVKPCQPQPSDRPSSPLTRAAASGLADDSGKQEEEEASAKMDQRPLSAIPLTPNNSQQPCTNEQVWPSYLFAFSSLPVSLNQAKRHHESVSSILSCFESCVCGKVSHLKTQFIWRDRNEGVARKKRRKQYRTWWGVVDLPSW